MYITLKEFAAIHSVTVQAVTIAARQNRIKTKILFGVIVVKDSEPYKPVRGRGLKKKKVESLE